MERTRSITMAGHVRVGESSVVGEEKSIITVILYIDIASRPRCRMDREDRQLDCPESGPGPRGPGFECPGLAGGWTEPNSAGPGHFLMVYHVINIVGTTQCDLMYHVCVFLVFLHVY